MAGALLLPTFNEARLTLLSLQTQCRYLVPPTTPQRPIQREKGMPTGDPMPFRLRPEGIKWPQFSSGQLTEIAKYFDAEGVLDNGTTVVISDARCHCQPPPFLVGGKLAVFLGEDEPLPFGCLSALGDPAGTPETGALCLGGTLQTELQRGEFPSLDSFAQILEL
jgi:hypothetical protein